MDIKWIFRLNCSCGLRSIHTVPAGVWWCNGEPSLNLDPASSVRCPGCKRRRMVHSTQMQPTGDVLLDGWSMRRADALAEIREKGPTE